MLAPFAPHLASELWANFCCVKHHLIDKEEVSLDKNVFEQKWPEIDMDYKMVLNVYVSMRIYIFFFNICLLSFVQIYVQIRY